MFKKYFWLYITIGLLVASGTFVVIPTVKAQTPTVFIDPNQVIGNLNPPPGSFTQWKVNVSNIGVPGIVGNEFSIALDPQLFREYRPITNGNFTTDASGWTPVPEITRGTATYGYYATDGNPSPGSGPGSYRMRANATGTQTASMYIALEQSVNWQLGIPPETGALLSFAYTISGNSFGTPSAGFVSVSVRVIKPDGTSISTLILTKTFTSAKSWSYNLTAANTGAFDQKGTYRFQIRSRLVTLGTATSDYVEIKWDDVGLMLAPVSVSQGTFYTSDPLNVGKTYLNAKYVKFPSNVSIYVQQSLLGETWKDNKPVTGSGTLAIVTLWTSYGATNLNLWGTILLEAGLVPPYTTTPIPHTAIGAYFSNKITGDIDGDADVDGVDFGLFAPTYGRTGLPPHFPSDFDGDGDVDGVDFGLFAPNYGRHYP